MKYLSITTYHLHELHHLLTQDKDYDIQVKARSVTEYGYRKLMELFEVCDYKSAKTVFEAAGLANLTFIDILGRRHRPYSSGSEMASESSLWEKSHPLECIFGVIADYKFGPQIYLFNRSLQEREQFDLRFRRGRYMGFADCCNKDFIEQLQKEPHERTNVRREGVPHLLCQACATKPTDVILQEIRNRRLMVTYVDSQANTVTKNIEFLIALERGLLDKESDVCKS